MTPQETQGIARPFTTEEGADQATGVDGVSTLIAYGTAESNGLTEKEAISSVDDGESTEDAGYSSIGAGAVDDATEAQQEDGASTDGGQRSADGSENTTRHPDASDGVSQSTEDYPRHLDLYLNAREKTTFSIPSDLDLRLGVIASCERRTRSVVIEEAFRLFVSNGTREPRPYLPDPGASSPVRITATVRRLYIDGMRSRAASEARTYPALVLRALYDYADASPFDLAAKGGDER